MPKEVELVHCKCLESRLDYCKSHLPYRANFYLYDGFYFVSIGYKLKTLWYFKVIGYKVKNVSPMA